MNNKLKGYLIGGGILIAGIAFAMFSGFMNVKMTLNTKNDKEEVDVIEEEVVDSSDEITETSPSEVDIVEVDLPVLSGDETAEAIVPEETEVPAEETVDIYAALEDVTNEAGEVIAEANEIRVLSPEEIEDIRNNYNGDNLGYLPVAEVDELNRPLNAVDLKTHFDERFGTNVVKILSEDTAEAHLIFVFSGASNEIANQILDVLGEKKVKATIFVDFAFVADNPMIISRLIAEGHEIGSVGATYPTGGLGLFALEDQMSDIWNLHQLVHTNYGYNMTKFYYGSGAYTDQSMALVTKMGYTPVIYTVSYPADSDGAVSINVEDYLWNIESKVHYGATYLFYGRNPATPQALGTFINFLTNSGYSITKIK